MLLLEQVKISDDAGKLVFEERQKVFPLMLSSRVTSVFGGAADRTEFSSHQAVRTKKVAAHKTNLTSENAFLNELYKQVRDFRESAQKDLEKLYPLLNELFSRYPKDWLLRVELLEVFNRLNPSNVFTAQLRTSLLDLCIRNPELKDLILRGMDLT